VAAVPVPDSESTDLSKRFDLTPLALAGMTDMVDLVQGSQGKPMAEWLPVLVEALRQAQMSDEQFLVAASREQPPATAESILALHFYQEPKACERLIYLTAGNQPAESIPILLALLRRNSEGQVGELTEKLLDMIPRRRDSVTAAAASRCVNVVRALRGATMEMDVQSFLGGIGQNGDSNLILNVAALFPDAIYGDREQVLSSVAKGSPFHIFDVLRTLRGSVPDGIDPAKTLDRIIFGIPWGKNTAVASDLKERGFTKEAERVLELEDEPPF
jgi:hypothetical protein